MKTGLYKLNCLTKSDCHDLRLLQEACYQTDGGRVKLYWTTLQSKRSTPGNFLYYKENTLIAYLSFFLFEEDAVHISAMVHPAYRRQGIFQYLFGMAKIASHHLGFNQFVFCIPAKNQIAKTYLHSLGGTLLYSEYQMMRNASEDERIESRDFILRAADSNDIELVAQIDHACFNTDYLIMLERYQKILSDPHRQCYLACVGSQIIGKVHVHAQTSLLIHDLCILPEWQNQRYGTALLKSLINELHHQGHSLLHLDVTANNDSALKLYQKCGFALMEEHHYLGIKES